MFWKILIFDYPDDKRSEYLYLRFAVEFGQAIPSFYEIKGVLERSNFTQESDDSHQWVHPVGIGVSIDLDVDGYLSKDYEVITVDELASILQFVIFRKRLAG